MNSLIAKALETMTLKPYRRNRILAQRRPETKETMPKTKGFDVATIKHHGTKLILPEGMTIPAAIDLLHRREAHDEKEVHFSESFDVFPWDGAIALEWALNELFGFAEGVFTPPKGPFDAPEPPRMIAVKVGLDKIHRVPWGTMRLPGDLGEIETGANKKDGRFRFSYTAVSKRKNADMIGKIAALVSKRLDTHSIYRGQALAVRFFDEDGNPLSMPEPEFIDTQVDESTLTFSDDVDMSIRTSLFTPIQRLDDLIANDIPIKRGVLLGGPYGTGKTMTAKVASKFAVANDITFIYVRKTSELFSAIQFAKPYATRAVVVFCEDIDSVVTEERTDKVNEILNTIDGVDTKAMNLITVLTTNHIEKISRALLRPGRLDAIIEVLPPDAKAVEKLLRVYGGKVIAKNADLRAIGTELAGAIPAVIAEVVKRAKLHQLALQKPDTTIRELSTQAILNSAKTLRAQRDLLADNGTIKIPTVEGALATAVKEVVNVEEAFATAVKEL